MQQIVYASAAAVPMSTTALQELLRAACLSNAICGVTGILLFHEGSFLQVLEGSESAVESTFARIQRDPRHTNVRILARAPIAVREFEGWSMSFLDTSRWDLSHGMIGYDAIPEFAASDTSAKFYLRLFHLGLCRQGALIAKPGRLQPDAK